MTSNVFYGKARPVLSPGNTLPFHLVAMRMASGFDKIKYTLDLPIDFEDRIPSEKRIAVFGPLQGPNASREAAIPSVFRYHNLGDTLHDERQEDKWRAFHHPAR